MLKRSRPIGNAALTASARSGHALEGRSLRTTGSHKSDQAAALQVAMHGRMLQAYAALQDPVRGDRKFPHPPPSLGGLNTSHGALTDETPTAEGKAAMQQSTLPLPEAAGRQLRFKRIDLAA